MGNSNFDSWLEWQKLIIREEYKDLNHIIPIRDKTQRHFEKSVQESLPKVKRND
jgi:hypothetical protein